MKFRNSLGFRFRWSGIHLTLSFLISCLVSLIVVFLWYPEPLWKISGGLSLIGLVVACDLILGPLITFLVANPSKPRRELKWDVVLIALVQLAALSYGMSVVFKARPIYIVFERDQYRVIRDADIPTSMGKDIAPEFANFPNHGPVFLSLRQLNGTEEQLTASAAEIEGIALGAQPKFWQKYEIALPDIVRTGKPLEQFLKLYPSHAEDAKNLIFQQGIALERATYFPFVDRSTYWTIVVERESGRPIGYLPVDPYEPEKH